MATTCAITHSYVSRGCRKCVRVDFEAQFLALHLNFGVFLRMAKRLIPVLTLLLVSALWGAHAVVGKAVEAQLDPNALTLWRFTFGALCYAPWFGHLKSLWSLSARRKWQILFTGLCFSVFYPLLYYQSLSLLTPVESLLLVDTAPFMAALFSRVLFKERLSVATWAGIAIAFSGVAVLVAAQWNGHFSLTGLGLALAAAAAFAAYTVASRSLFRQFPLVDVLTATSVVGAVSLWVIVPLFTPFHSLVNALSPLSRTGWVELAYIVLIVSTLAYALYGFGLKRVPTGIASALTFYPQVIFGALLQWLWLGIPPGVPVYISALLILCGSAVMQWGGLRRGTVSMRESA
ncbi:hypothetical protein D2Q93_15220 [Alicyclobacillaceae bacterium I2511]|nr:hypothetical protein D2Q93_15220 [Alicyclobacillaceae bacterium I2511]